MLAAARTFTLVGVSAEPVTVEVDVQPGLPTFSLVGLPDAAVRESRERVRAAVVNSGFDFPLQRLTASLAPADLRKAGPAFDLAIAAGLLCARDRLPSSVLDRYALAGELALDGSLRPIHGVLAMAEAARRVRAGLIVPSGNVREAALVDGLEVIGVDSLSQLVGLGSGEWTPTPVEPPPLASANGAGPDLSDVRGQPMLCRSLEIAAAGGHNLLVVGPPGAGKTMAARRLPSILPPLDRQEALEVIRIQSACGRRFDLNGHARRPFRAPHHSVSHVGLVGGGNPPTAGEITLAHRGVLFLDELGEFSRAALEALRQPLEDGTITISRARHRLELPCRFVLVAAANPCPCGHHGSGDCRCRPGEIERYHARLSGALADRIDISLGVNQPSAEALQGPPADSSADVRGRVAASRRIQAERLGPGRSNGEMDPAEIRRHCGLEGTALELLKSSHRDLGLSGRGHDRVLRVARTIADLAECSRIGEEHLSEAIGLRRRGATS